MQREPIKAVEKKASFRFKVRVRVCVCIIATFERSRIFYKFQRKTNKIACFKTCKNSEALSNNYPHLIGILASESIMEIVHAKT